MRYLENIGPKTRAFFTGLAITSVLVLAGGLLQISATTDPETWGKFLLIGEANAIGGYIIATLKRGGSPPQ